MAHGSDVQLSDRERRTVTAVLRQFAACLGPIKAFGSRATGIARPGSDLDLVIFPPAPSKELGRLREAFEDSDLPITVDVLAWDEIEHERLRDQIAQLGVPFFDPATPGGEG